MTKTMLEQSKEIRSAGARLAAPLGYYSIKKSDTGDEFIVYHSRKGEVKRFPSRTEAERYMREQEDKESRMSAGSRLAGEPDDSLQLQPLPNEMPGGLGDKLTPANVDPVEFDMGMEMEKEHTPDEATRQEIVLDHLAEDPAYYSKLKQMEGQGVDVQMFGQMRATKL
jgi:hypothetical protein